MNRKSYFSLFFVFLFSISCIFAQFARLRVADPQRWGADQGTIEEATVTLKSKGIYTEIGLYLTFSARGSRYQAGDTLEVDLDFYLPEEALIIDSWLWIDDQIIKAKILDRWTASNIYEEIVNRRRDPSILTKERKDQYQLRVFPMAAEESRRVKITYLIPGAWSPEEVLTDLPGHILRASRFPVDLSVRAWMDDGWQLPKISGWEDAPFSFEEEEGVSIAETVVPWANLDGSAKFGVKALLHQGVHMTYSPDSKVYQMVFFPQRALDLGEKSRKRLLVLLDYQAANSRENDFNLVLKHIKNQLLLQLSDRDLFNVMWSGLETKTYNETWLPADESTITTVFSDLEEFDFPAYSSLPALLAGGLQYLDAHEENGEILLFANSSQYGRPEAANPLLEDLMEVRGEHQYAVNISDFQNRNQESYWLNSRYFRGNEYFYTNLSRLTGGSFYSWHETPNLNDIVEAVFQEASSLKGTMDLHTTLDNGFCYNRFNLSQSGEQLNLAAPLYQIGKYEGSFPFVLEVAGVTGDQVFSDAILIDEPYLFASDSIAAKTWTGQYIQELEASGGGNRVISEVIDLSIRNRILSLYTAFLALEPSRGGEVCNNCTDESGGELTDITEISGPDSLLFLKAFPNPFHEAVTIQIATEQGVDWDGFQAGVYDLNGRKIRSLSLPKIVAGKQMELRWNGGNEKGLQAPAGIYYFVLRSQKRQYSLKLMKLE